eukprot:gnl/TRDRNA2_/TRDRNA2_41842_c0_seq2.p1 gnl/TRDRNA2_/TRDRNA2_41842_c0~~gnl/TRDRNA2_/TRDRNA2_41842_c0_seq2.p1  ORF type:complete len:288 (+),score=86.81 gnl/TRDRNA2_/TRDRNA2_41842_c0_seq2:37-864(+)
MADEARLELEHEFLDSAKSFQWADVKAKLESSPDLINAQPCHRWTACHQAAFEGNKDMVEFLIKKGADLNATTRGGQKPLDVAKGAAKTFIESSATSESKEASDKAEEPPKKKAKTTPERVYTMNINNAVDKEYEGSSLTDIAAAPTSALQGVAQKGQDVLKKFGVKTIRQLGSWKFYKMSKAIVGLAALEETGKREEGAELNLNKALDKKHELKTLQEIVKLPPSALSGLAGWADAELASIHIKTIGQLGEWKFAHWAEWITDLSAFESADFSS